MERVLVGDIRNADRWDLYDNNGEYFGCICLPKTFNNREVNKLIRNGMGATAVRREI